MSRTVVGQRDLCLIAGQRHAVELSMDDTAANAAWVLDSYVIVGGVVSEYDSEARPCFWYARIQKQRRSLHPEPEDPLEAGLVHPSSRAGVPGPSATPDMRRAGIDVSGNDIGFYLVAVDVGPGAGVVDGIEQGEQRERLVALVEGRECDHRPQGSMCILAAVLADAGRVALDVARIERRLVEWRRKQQRHLILRPNQLAFERRHGARRAYRAGRTRDHRPGLRDRIDAALVIRRRPERRAVIEPGAPVPVAVPRLALQRGLQRAGVGSPCRRAGRVLTRIGERREFAERRI